MTATIECKLCGIPQTDSVEFHSHHIKFRVNGGSNEKENLVKICSDCHFGIHHPSHHDGDLLNLEEDYKRAISMNIFSDGYGIIPNKIAHDPKISNFAKILYCDISSLCASRGYCWATNEYFAKVFKVNSRTISRAIVELEPFLIIRNRMSAQRTIWVHQLGSIKPFKVGSDIDVPTKPKKEKVEKVEKKPAQLDLMLAELLLSRIIYNFPLFENRTVKTSEWAEDIRKLREIDKATPEQIRFMITWIQGGEIEVTGKPNRVFEPHDFWSKNIMSAKKMRKQWFDHLVPQLQTALKKDTKKHAVAQL